MKKILYLFSIICVLFTSCYKDDSNANIEDINPIMIDFGTAQINTVHSVYMLDTLRLNPIIYKKGLPDAKLKFEWHLSGNDIIPYVMDSTMTLCAYVTAPPQTLAYTLRLTVIDERGIKKTQKFSINVLSAFSEGLVVADTKDGVNSDLSLIVDRCFNPSINDKKNLKIFRDAYSDVNGEMIEGVVRDMQTANFGANRSLTVLTDKRIIRADYYDFAKKENECDKGIFIIPPTTIDATFITRDNKARDEHMFVNGLLYTRGTQNGNRLYNFYRYPTETPKYKVTHMYCPQSSNPPASFAFDEQNGKIIFVQANKIYHGKEQLPNQWFDVNNLTDYECLHLGQVNTWTMVMLARRKSDNNYMGLLMYPSYDNPEDNYAMGTFNLTNSPDINNAKYYALNVIEEVVYYATETKIYATPIDNISAKVQYETNSGEKITGMQIWTSFGSIDYEDLDPDNQEGFESMSTYNRMMLVTVYNESTKEGKVIAIPIITLGIGGLEPNKKFHVEFGGFGRILKIAKQEK